MLLLYALLLYVRIYVLAVSGRPVDDGCAELAARGRFRHRAAQREGRALIGVKGGKSRGEVAREGHRRRAAVRKGDGGRKLLLRPRRAQQPDGCRVFAGVCAVGDFLKLQFHVRGCAVRAVRDVQRCGYARKRARDVRDSVRRSARRFDDERELPYLLPHHGGERVFRVRLYRDVRSRSEQPARSVADECARLSGGWGCRLHACRRSRDGGMLRRVVGVNTIFARLEEMVEPVGYATDSCRIIGCHNRVARGSGQPLADAAPVGGQRDGAVLRMRGVVDGVFHVAPRQQCGYRRPDKLIYPVSFHISRF